MSDAPRERFLSALRDELRGHPLIRRRVLAEIAAHLDDTVAELEARGLSEDAAVQEALDRLGDIEAIASAFRVLRRRRRSWRWVGSLRSPAWVAVGALSLLTAWAAELPQASGAKATTRSSGATYSRHLARAVRGRPGQREHRLTPVRVRHPGRP